MARGLGVVFAVALGSGCGSRSCPVPGDEAEPEWADANADGVVDINDGVRIARHALSHGPPPACRGQGDLTGVDHVAFEAAGHIWYWLFVGHASGMPEWEGCEVRWPSAAEPPPCARVGLSFDAPKRVQSSTFEARVLLRAKGLEPGPDAWSFGVGAEGCRVVSATLSGTAADHTFADPPGIVAEGFAHAEVVDGGAITAVVPSWLEPVYLERAESGRDVLVLELEADVPASGCAPCELSFRDDLKGAGQPVAVVAGLYGWSYAPSVHRAEIDVCGD